MTKAELYEIIRSDESYRIERTISTGNMDKFQNAGGLYGNARPENFPKINDYRNPIIAGAMKSLGYVNRYNRGIGQVQKELTSNGNPEADFDVNLLTAFSVTVQKGTSRAQVKKQKGTSQEVKGDKLEDKRAQVEYQFEGERVPVKGSSLSQKEHRPFGPNILTLQERIIEFCITPKSMAEIADFLGVKNRRKARERYINPQLGKTLAMTVPDKPNSRLQKYVAIKTTTISMNTPNN